jgi:predicted amidohydrolase
VLATAADSETVIVAELQLERLHEVRDRLPSLASRRPEVYAWPEETAIR